MNRTIALLKQKRRKMLAFGAIGAILGGALAFLVLDRGNALSLAAGMLLGFFALSAMAGMCCIIAHFSNSTINSPERLSISLNSPVLACIPHCTGSDNHKNASLTHLVESYNTLRNNIGYVSGNKRLIAVTSATPGDGKTTVAINLAKTYLGNGKKVAVIDADMRNPSVHKRFRLKNKSGLSEVLELDEQALFIKLKEFPSLYVLCAGARPADPSALLKSRQMKALLKQALELFDYVIIDAPPVIPVPDCAALSQIVDTIVFVSRYGQTDMIAAHRACDALALANRRVAGGVLNDVPADVCKGYGKPAVRAKNRAAAAVMI